MDIIQYGVGDKVVTKKAHACGEKVWIVTRVGADIKLTCQKCGRTIMITRDEANKIIKKRVEEDK